MPYGSSSTPTPFESFLPSESQIAFVAKCGDDDTGNGSLTAPFLTIGAAMAAIEDASAAKPYHIAVFPGVYTEASLQLKAYVTVGAMGGRVQILDAGGITLGTGWTSDAVGGLVDVTLVLANLTADFTATVGENRRLILRDVNFEKDDVMGNSGTLVVKGGPTDRCEWSGGQIQNSVTFSSCLGFLRNLHILGTVTVNDAEDEFAWVSFFGVTVSTIVVAVADSVNYYAGVELNHSKVRLVTLNGLEAYMESDVASLPDGLPTLQNSATIDNVTVAGAGVWFAEP